MALSGTQQGTIGENEVAKIGMMTTDGGLEFDNPATDDEARDREAHERGHFGVSVAIQIKTSMKIQHDRRKKAPLLTIEFRVRHLDRVLSHPLYWFLFAFLDAETMTFRDPVFLIPSSVLMAHLKPRSITHLNKHEYLFMFRGNMTPESHDMWAPYKVALKDLGPRLVEILHEAEKTAAAGPMPDAILGQPGTLHVRRRRAASRLRPAA